MGSNGASPEAKHFDIVIDGEKVPDDWVDQMTFREQRDFRNAVREMFGDPHADVDPEQMALLDFIPALVYVTRKRKIPTYTLDLVLDSKPTDFLVEVQDDPGEEGEQKRPPTAAGKRTRSAPAKST